MQLPKTPTPTFPIDADHLPLNVREHLMRGQHAAAVKCLVDKHELDKAKAEQLIENYRQNLRERKIELDIKIMQEQQRQEGQEESQLLWRWGLRAALVLLFLTLVYLMVEMATR